MVWWRRTSYCYWIIIPFIIRMYDNYYHPLVSSCILFAPSTIFATDDAHTCSLSAIIIIHKIIPKYSPRNLFIISVGAIPTLPINNQCFSPFFYPHYDGSYRSHPAHSFASSLYVNSSCNWVVERWWRWIWRLTTMTTINDDDNDQWWWRRSMTMTTMIINGDNDQ